MNTNVDTSLEHFLSIVEGIEEPCEHSEHENNSRLHSGKGEWYVKSVTCNMCSHAASGLLCDKFFKWATGSANVKLTCPNCDATLGYGLEAFTSIKRKG